LQRRYEVTPKFRAWIKDYQVMRSVEFLAFNEKGVAEIFTNPEDGEPEDFRHTHSPEQAILMQSTGKKDLNGKEIFEGDILENERTEFLDHMFRNRKTIKDRWAVSTVEEFNRLWRACLLSSCRIIGNIYENPELL